MTRRELRAQGEATLKDLFGSADHTRGAAKLSPEPVYGGIWNRPGVARAGRTLHTSAALATCAPIFGGVELPCGTIHQRLDQTCDENLAA